MGRLLHIACPACSAAQCRGCSARAPNCDKRCAADQRCPLTVCCKEVRAIAIFEILSDFDKRYSASSAKLSGTDIWPVPKAEREDFLHLVISRVDRETAVKFNELLFNTLTAINFWLLPENEQQIHPSVKHLLSSSFLFEAIHGFLGDGNHHNWIINGNVYAQVMKLLRLLGNRRCLNDLLHGRLPVIHLSSGVQVWMWYRGHSVWESDQSHDPLYDAVFSNDAQRAVARLETILRRQDLRDLTATIREDFQRLTLLSAGGPELP